MPPARHPVERLRHHLQRLRRAAAQEELERRGGRELGCPAEAAVRTVERARDALLRLGQQRRRERLGRRLDPRRVADRLDEPLRLRDDVVALRPPGLRHREQELRERRHPVPRLGREVGACVERLARRREEDRHRPAALTRHRDGRVHVERVDVGPLLAIDLDVDEVLVHQRRRRRALERLVRHHVAPVAGAVADREQDRPVLRPAPARAPRRPTGTSRPGCRRAGGGTGSSRRRGGSCEHRTHAAQLRAQQARARDESSEQSSGRPGGAAARRTGRPATSSASSARETSSAPATLSGPETSSDASSSNAAARSPTCTGERISSS